MLDKFTAENAGVPASMIEPGLAVMVTCGAVSAAVNGGATIVAYGVVAGPTGEAGKWWVEVHTGGGTTLPQMYRETEFLGVPALGLLPSELHRAGG